jgi:hypothetical protein
MSAININGMAAASGRMIGEANVAINIADLIRTLVESGVIINGASLTTLADYPAGATPFSGPPSVSGANSVNTLTQPAGGAGICNYCSGFSVAISGAAVDASPVTVTVKDGTNVLWEEIIPAAQAIGSALSKEFLKPLKGTAATPMTLNIFAAGALCVTIGNMHGYQL